MKAMPERFRVTVEAAGSGPPAIIRLRTFLKRLLRVAGLRCTNVEELSDGQVHDDSRNRVRTRYFLEAVLRQDLQRKALKL